MQHLDPAGVGARDLRECLAIQIAAQQQEFDHLYGAGRTRLTRRRNRPAWQLPRRGRGKNRRAAAGMEVAALIVDHHLPLLQKRDVKDLARAAQVTAGRGARGGRVHPHARSAAGTHVQPRADAADRARRGFCEARRRVGGEHERGGPAQPAPQPALPAHAGLSRHRKGSEGVREGAVPLRAATDAQHRAAQEHHSADVRSDCAAAAGVSRQGRGRRCGR